MASLKPADRRRFALGLTGWVVACQVGLIAAFVLDPSDPPRVGGSLGHALWALAHKPAFYPLVLVGITGPPATWLAWSLRGVHRGVLVLAWAAFLAVIGVFFLGRVGVMIQVLLRHGGA